MPNATPVAHDELLRRLDYDPETGVFQWSANDANRTRKGTLAGWTRSDGYRQVELSGRSYKAHRLAWFYVHGEWPDDQIDHINGDRSDNRIANLRDVTQSQNLQNRTAPRSDSGSPYIGVSPTRYGKWQARIRAEGRRRLIGHFDTAEEASAAYQNAKRELHPFAPPRTDT